MHASNRRIGAFRTIETDNSQIVRALVAHGKMHRVGICPERDQTVAAVRQICGHATPTFGIDDGTRPWPMMVDDCRVWKSV